jgi:hydrogen peroxide-dependent heme synthase
MNEATYAYYSVFRATPDLRERAGREVEQMAYDADILLKEWADTVTVRGTYSTVGLRPDADLLMWWVAGSLDDLQDLFVEFRRTPLGRRLELTWSFTGLVRPAEFTPDHAPAFLRGEPARSYVCVYPFVRTPEWYLLPPDERASMLREHGELGREFPDVLANTTMAFGLGDWEWILAFEAEDPGRIVDCIRRLREAAARRYTKEEVPFVMGLRKDLPDVVRDLA